MTIEEWLGKENQLGIDIWKRKYRHNNEDFEQWLDRVSGDDKDLRQLIAEKKFLFGGRILANRGVAPKGVTYSNCFRGDTKIITDNGVKELRELVGKNIKVLSKSSWREATVQSFGEQPLMRLTLTRGKSVRTYYVTANHQWFVDTKKQRILKSTKELSIGDVIPREVLKCYRTYKPSPFGIAHGLFMGDGDHGSDRKSLRMNLCGDKEELLPYFTPDTIGYNGDTLTINGMPKFFTRFPSLDETPSYLYGWLAGYFAADGSIDERGSCVICSCERKNLEFVQDILCVLGIPSESIRAQNRISNLTGKMGTVYILGLNKYYLNENFFILSKHKQRFLENPPLRNDEWRVKLVEHTDFVEEVFCAVVPETECFALEGNILTHNCYVLTTNDSIEGIYETCRDTAKTMSSGGGVGIDISPLRPAGAKVHNSASTTTGAVSFMQTFSMVSETIGQKNRRGALMISIDVRHPDVMEFVNIKTDLNKVLGANISIRVTDEFMETVEQDGEFVLRWPCDFHISKQTFDSLELDKFTQIDTVSGPVYLKKIKARKLFDQLAVNNWDYAEPGILYWDTIEKRNLLQYDNKFHYAGVNPCAEEPLPDGGSCLLGSLNLAEFVTEHQTFADTAFEKAVRIAIRGLNDVLDEGLPLHPLEIQRKTVNDWRQCGLGIMGLADMLIKMHIRYDSEEALHVCDRIGQILATIAIDESNKIGKEKGPYPKLNADAVSKSDFYQNHIKFYETPTLRNSQLLTIAPTGTISTLINASGGLEPLFALKYTRTTKSLHDEDTVYEVFTPLAKEWMNQHPGQQLPDYFVDSSMINPEMRVRMQGVWQKHIDASISSTVNLPEETTVDTVRDIYINAWKNGLKGITVFRSGCKRIAILNTDKPKDSTTEEGNPNKDAIIQKVSNNCIGKKRTLTTGCGTLHLTAFFHPQTGRLLETYFSKGSTGGCHNFMVGLSRMVSLAARANVSIDDIIDQLKSSGTCPSYAVRRATKNDTSIGSSCPVAIGNALREMYEEMQSELNDCRGVKKFVVTLPTKPTNKCPECGGELVSEMGCVTCHNCGYSKCG